MSDKSKEGKNVFIPRITQLDANEFDKEVHNVLVSELMEISKYLKPGALNSVKLEVNLLICLLIFHFSVIKKNATFGQELLGLKYSTILSKNQLGVYALINYILPYLYDKYENISRRIQNTSIRNLFKKVEIIVQMSNFLNHFLFVREGKYPTIADRLLKLKYTSSIKLNPSVGYNYMTRELLWHGFMELLMHVLPLINYNAIKRKIRESLLGKSSVRKNVQSINYDCDTKCVVCDDLPNLPCQISIYCPHLACYYCIKSNILADSKFMCPSCGERNTATENLLFLSDLGWINKVSVSSWCIYDSVKDVKEQSSKLQGIYRAAWLLKAVSCIDLTTLSGDDTCSNVARLCCKAAKPISSQLQHNLNFTVKPFTTAAVCVYPARVQNAVQTITKVSLTKELPVAAVATGFPSGQFDLSSRLMEIKHCIENGASEIDIVIDRSLVLTGQWELLYQELQQMKEACGTAKMKTILAVGELANFRNIYKASLVSMMAGSDFIKTSTGKETVNATLPVGLVMIRAIEDYYKKTAYKVGFKAAGGIKTSEDALNWLVLVKRELGTQWLNKSLFRIGASSLLNDIEKELYFLANQKSPAHNDFTLG